jgi:hypothetical protein
MSIFVGIFCILHALVHLLYAGQALRFFELRPGLAGPTTAAYLARARQVRDELSQHFPGQREALNRYFRWVEIGGSSFRHLVESGMMFGQGILPKVLNLLVKHPLMPWASLKD